MKNTAYKAWKTRYENAMNILKREMDELREELYTDFMEFLEKMNDYYAKNTEYERMRRARDRLHAKGNGGP